MAKDPYDVFVDMEFAWRSSIPKKLQGMEPWILIHLLTLATPEQGISQSAAASQLGRSQSGMSRITAKLVAVKWVTVRRSSVNHKQKLMTATPEARFLMHNLKATLAGAMKAPVAPRPLTEVEILKRQFKSRLLLSPSIQGE